MKTSLLINKLFSKQYNSNKNQWRYLKLPLIHFGLAIIIYVAAMLFALKTPNVDLAHPQTFLYSYFRVEIIDGVAHSALSYIGIILLVASILHLLFTILVCFYLRARFSKPLFIISFSVGAFAMVFFGLITGLPVAFDKEYLALFHDGVVSPIGNDRVWISNLFIADHGVIKSTWLYWFDTAFYIVFNILGQISNVFTLKKFYRANFK